MMIVSTHEEDKMARFFYLTRLIPTLGLILLTLLACDPDKKKECEWLLEPDESREELVTDKLVPACARNYKSQKQDCRLLVPRELAKAWEKKKFRYSDMKVKDPSIPRLVTSLSEC